MTLYERARRWLERQLGREQEELSRWNRLLLQQLRLYVFVAREILSGEYMMRAGALVFATVLALVPLGTVGFSLFRAFGGLGGGKLDEVVEQKLAEYFLAPLSRGASRPAGVRGGDGPREAARTRVSAPEGAAAEERQRILSDLSGKVTETIRQLVQHASGPKMSVFSVAMLILSALLLFDTIESAFNRIWHVERQRSFWVKFPAFFTLLTLGPFLIGLSIYLTREFKPASYVGLSPLGERVLARLTSVATTCAAFVIGYKLLPFTRVRWRPVLAGAVVAAVAWEVAKWGFGVYIQDAVYTRVYGSLAVFPIFLLWVYITWIIVLFGAGVSYTTQNLGAATAGGRRMGGAWPVNDRLALGVMLAVARRYVAGRGSTPLDEVIDQVDAVGGEVQRTAMLLARAGLLEAVGSDARRIRYVPARPLDRVTVADVLAAAARENAAACRLRGESERRGMERLFEQMESKRGEVAGGVTLRRLVDEALAAEGTGPVA